MQRVIFSLLIFLVSYTSFSQQKYVTEEEFNEKISWLEVHETHLYLKDVLRKVPGATNSTNNWLVDGTLYTYPPMLYASQIKYIEVVNNVLQGNMCQCNLIVKTTVTEKELVSRKNILNRLNKNIVEEPKKKKKKKKKS